MILINFASFDSQFERFQTISTVVFCIIILGFIFILGLVIYSMIKNVKIRKSIYYAPVLTTDATVVAKRSDVKIHRHHSQNTMGYTTSSTTYYVTFQVPSGDRMEFVTQDYEYGLLVENDTGRLTFQGNRFLEFERMVCYNFH